MIERYSLKFYDRGMYGCKAVHTHLTWKKPVIFVFV